MYNIGELDKKYVYIDLIIEITEQKSNDILTKYKKMKPLHLVDVFKSEEVYIKVL